MSIIKIDSLRIRIKAKNVKFLDSELTDKFARVNLNTAELVEDQEEKGQRLKKEVNGCRYDYQIRRYNINGHTEIYLVMTLNSKMLREQYFEGLTLLNLKKIYQDVMEMNIVKFEWNVFLNQSYAVDIDFCLDFMADQNIYQGYLAQLMELTPMTRDRDRGYKVYEGGLEWNSRSSATECDPYFKIYNKDVELRKRSWKFTDSFLGNVELENLRRFEFTIKGAKHMKSFGVPDSSLYTILEISQEERRVMLKGVVEKIFDLSSYKQTLSLSEQELKPDRLVLLQALRTMALVGLKKENVIEELTRSLTKSNKTKHRQKLLSLWENFVDVAQSKRIGTDSVLNILYQ